MNVIATTNHSSSFLRFGVPQRTKTYESFSTSNYAPFNAQLKLFGDIAPKWKIIRPLALTIEQDEDDYYIVSDDEFLVYGYGKTKLLAQQDYTASLIEYYQLLEAKKAPLTQAMFSSLQSYLFHAN